MKKRVFLEMDDAVFRVTVDTEDWSEGDLDLMHQYGEPEVNVGGDVTYLYNGEQRTKALGDIYVRVLHGFPYAMGFDSRDYGSTGEATNVGVAWKEQVLSRIDSAVTALRANNAQFPTEEVSEI